jgi:hypothetical protein
MGFPLSVLLLISLMVRSFLACGNPATSAKFAEGF